MEIVLAFLLFFGGFAVGTISDDKAGDDTPATTARPPADEASDTLQVTQTTRLRDPIQCEAHPTVIYRDLTLPISYPDHPRSGQAGSLKGTRPDD